MNSKNVELLCGDLIYCVQYTSDWLVFAYYVAWLTTMLQAHYWLLCSSILGDRKTSRSDRYPNILNYQLPSEVYRKSCYLIHGHADSFLV